jgi:hypothetical protein
MRKWLKYFRNSGTSKITRKPKDKTFNEHSQAMGGYQPDDSYSSREEFFNKHLNGLHAERFANYDKFLRKHLKKEDKILSVASGRCVNELYLLNDGYKSITCSDLGIFPACSATKTLFPDFSFMTLNILDAPSPQKYDSIIALSLIYLFDEQEFDVFLSNVADSLEEEGAFILDSAGAPDNFLTFIIHDIILRVEVYLSGLFDYIKSLGKRKFGVTVHAFGYRRKDNDIISVAEKAGFQLIEKVDYGFISEFRRSKIFRRLVNPNSSIEKIFMRIGKKVPYTRMFYFRKTNKQTT